MTLDDPKLFEHPWIYIVEPGAMKFTDTEAARLREFLLRGGTAMFDDFHGPFEWENLERQMKRVFPDRKIVEVPKDHPVFSAFYKIDGYPQVPGIGSFLAGRTWEKGGFVSHLRTILDDAGRPMMFINWNTDMGDGWEWSNVVEYPGYMKHTAMAYRMAINEIVYSPHALTPWTSSLPPNASPKAASRSSRSCARSSSARTKSSKKCSSRCSRAATA